jgi:hypothetical protein
MQAVQLNTSFCVIKYIMGRFTLNSITHYLDHLVQILEATRLHHTKYHAASTLQSIIFTNRIHDVWNELPGCVVNSFAPLRYPGMPNFRLISVVSYCYPCAVYIMIIFALLLNTLLRQRW